MHVGLVVLSRLWEFLPFYPRFDVAFGCAAYNGGTSASIVCRDASAVHSSVRPQDPERSRATEG